MVYKQGLGVQGKIANDYQWLSVRRLKQEGYHEVEPGLQWDPTSKKRLGGYAKASRAQLEINVLPGMSLLKLCLFNPYPASS